MHGGTVSHRLATTDAGVMGAFVKNDPDDYEYRKTTLNLQKGTLPQPIAVVTVGVPKARVEQPPIVGITDEAFKAAIGRSDLRELLRHLHLDVQPGLSQAISFQGWQAVPKPTNARTFQGDGGTLFWVEKL
jgi:hypothetical protein